jgi:hypothetical protein
VGLSGHIFVVPRFPSKSGLLHKHIVKHIVNLEVGGGHWEESYTEDEVFIRKRQVHPYQKKTGARMHLHQ